MELVTSTKPKSDYLIAAFHKGGSNGGKDTPMQKIIKWRTGHWSCHIEAFFPDTGLSFSARGFDNLVGWKNIEYSHPERWMFFELRNIPVGSKRYIQARDRAHILQGMKYDYFGAVMNKAQYHNQKWYCYESFNHIMDWCPCNVYGSRTLDRCVRLGGAEIWRPQ
jgi:hypothetical protein